MSHNRANINWNLEGDLTWDKVHCAVLMDIRRELQTLNRLLACSNFTQIPHILKGIRKNTTKKRRKAQKK